MCSPPALSLRPLHQSPLTCVCDSLCLALSPSLSPELSASLRRRFLLSPLSSLSLSLEERFAFLLRLLSLRLLLRFLCLRPSLRLDDRLRCNTHMHPRTHSRCVRLMCPPSALAATPKVPLPSARRCQHGGEPDCCRQVSKQVACSAFDRVAGTSGPPRCRCAHL